MLTLRTFCKLLFFCAFLCTLRRPGLWAFACFACTAVVAKAGPTDNDPPSAAQTLIAEHEALVRPLERKMNLAWWDANVSGRDSDFAAKEAAQNQLDGALADRARFARLKALENAGKLDGQLARQVHLLFLAYQEKQVSTPLLAQIAKKANAIEQTFNVFRPTVDGNQLSDNDIVSILSKTTDAALAQRAWEASKAVGTRVASELIALVKLRNDAAHELGYRNYHAMQLALNEQDPAEVIALFDELYHLTEPAFVAVKADLDQRLAHKFNLSVDALRPWHYGDLFFQEAPAVYGVDADAVFAKVDLVDLARKFYASIGLPVDDVVERSDLYEKPGKSPHAFCTDIDREGDVRVLCNLRATEKWQNTLLHELGHAVYSSKNIPATLPYVLRGEAHILTTEGVAMMFERLTTHVDFLAALGVHVDDPQTFSRAEAQKLRAQLLIFSRWCQVMLRFEQALYEKPDQDLNTLWWDLVEKYQHVTRPENRHAPDYASKIHIVSAPCYYHNYMMGQLFASQVHHTIAAEVQHQSPEDAIYVGDTNVGMYMKERVFAPGRTLTWNELTRFATGKPLTAQAFAADFSGSSATHVGHRNPATP